MRPIVLKVHSLQRIKRIKRVFIMLYNVFKTRGRFYQVA